MKLLSFKSPVLLLILVNILAFLMLFFYLDTSDYHVLLVGGSLLGLTVLTYGILYFFRLGDAYLFLIVSMLLVFGVTMLCRLNYDVGMKQIGWYLIALCAFYVTFFIYRYAGFLRKLKWLYYAAGLALFVLTLTIGVTRGGAKNWIVIAGRNFQPSELIKLIYVFFLASYYSGRRNRKIAFLPEKYIIAACVCSYLGLLVLQREWGIAVLFFLTYMVMEYLFEQDRLIMSCSCLLAVLGGILGYRYMYHIQVRVENWLNPWEDIAGKGYQITQSLFAIAEGGFFGKGLGGGKPSYIPEVHSDFIFSAICEELGIFGGTAVILLFFIFVYRGIKISLCLHDGFDKCIAAGITAMFGFQTFMIIGGVIKMIPLTGITLPFVSYGGSSLVTSFMALGILQAVSAKGEGR